MPEIERVTAVDGKTLDRGALADQGLVTLEARYTPGAVGNALSHMARWNEVAADGRPATILEDDAVLCCNFVEEATRLIGTLGPDWEFVQWGYNFDTVLSYDLLPGVTSCTALFNQAQMRGILPVFHQRDVRSSVYRIIRSLGMPAYSVSPRGAARFLSFCQPIRPLDVEFPLLGKRPNFSIDFMMNGVYPAMAAYVAVPALALTANDTSQSTVQDLNDHTGPAQPARITTPIGSSRVI